MGRVIAVCVDASPLGEEVARVAARDVAADGDTLLFTSVAEVPMDPMTSAMFTDDDTLTSMAAASAIAGSEEHAAKREHAMQDTARVLEHCCGAAMDEAGASRKAWDTATSALEGRGGVGETLLDGCSARGVDQIVV
eukprot:253749_1